MPTAAPIAGNSGGNLSPATPPGITGNGGNLAPAAPGREAALAAGNLSPAAPGSEAGLATAQSAHIATVAGTLTDRYGAAIVIPTLYYAGEYAARPSFSFDGSPVYAVTSGAILYHDGVKWDLSRRNGASYLGRWTSIGNEATPAAAASWAPYGTSGGIPTVTVVAPAAPPFAATGGGNLNPAAPGREAALASGNLSPATTGGITANGGNLNPAAPGREAALAAGNLSPATPGGIV